MGILKNFLQYIYNSTPSIFFRNELKRKAETLIKAALIPTTKKLSKQINHLHKELDKVSRKQEELFNSQNQYLNNVAKEDRSWHVDLKHMHAHADKKHDKQLFFLKNIFEKQGFNTYFAFRNEFIDDISSIIKSIIRSDYPHISNNLDSIISEILIGHMYAGGSWQLRQNINFFKDKALPYQGDIKTPANSEYTSPNKPLKILIISGTFPSLMHGGGNRLFDIILELSKNNQVDLYTHFDPNLDDTSLAPIQNKVENIKLVNYQELTEDLIGAWLRSINRDNNYYDIIQLEYPQTSRFITKMRAYGKRIGFTFMESLSMSFTEKLELTLKNQDYYNISQVCNSFWDSIASEKFVSENADFTIAVTHQDKDFIQRLTSKQPYIIPTCVSDFSIIEEGLRIEGSIDQEENSVMFLGFFGHWPNIEAVEWYLSSIHPKVKAAIPTYKFYIVGSGDISRINELAEGDSTVVITGRVESVVPNILRSKLCISPLISGAGIRGKQNQYSLLNRPSVTTSIGNKGLEYVHEESVLVADSANDFSNNIIRMLTDKALYSKIQANAKSIAQKHYTWGNHVKQLTKIYTG